MACRIFQIRPMGICLESQSPPRALGAAVFRGRSDLNIGMVGDSRRTVRSLSAASKPRITQRTTRYTPFIQVEGAGHIFYFLLFNFLLFISFSFLPSFHFFQSSEQTPKPKKSSCFKMWMFFLCEKDFWASVDKGGVGMAHLRVTPQCFFFATRKSCGVCWARRFSCHGLLWSRCGELPTAYPRKGTGVLRVLIDCDPPVRYLHPGRVVEVPERQLSRTLLRLVMLL